MQRRLQGLACAIALTLLSGCGFKPLYGTSDLVGESMSSKLASVNIPEQPTRAGQLIRNAILSVIAPAGTRSGTDYRFDMTPKTSEEDSVEAQNTDVLRRSYRLTVAFDLVDVASGKSVYSGKTFSYVSYDR
ncbi:MAG TPA: hypothetical protein VJ998_05900, partial [Pseudomonadales bacterium]|nr:hypothetical protein [Pseudomonadales bacterium]